MAAKVMAKLNKDATKGVCVARHVVYTLKKNTAFPNC